MQGQLDVLGKSYPLKIVHIVKKTQFKRLTEMLKLFQTRRPNNVLYYLSLLWLFDPNLSLASILYSNQIHDIKFTVNDRRMVTQVSVNRHKDMVETKVWLK